MQFLIDDGDEHIDGDGNPDLKLDRILRGTEEGLDTKMVFDPFDKQLDPPSAAINLGDGCRRRRG